MLIQNILSLLLLFSQLTAKTTPGQQPPQKILGGGNYGSETLDSLEISGLAKLHGTTVTNQLAITGSLISLYAHLNQLEVNGEANLTDTQVDSQGTITGALQATRSTFLQKLTLLTQKAVFTHCKLNSITVLQDAAFKGKQTIELKQGTIVNGSITFEGGKGQVLLYRDSQILGSVSGGKIIRR